ncbi:MAG: NAAT family transporter [Akkermansiaceae bacterium]|nr:NAAT family transporter [Akkermansiaceae bacterium]
MDWSYIVATASALFLVMDPPGNAPLVQGLLQKIEPKRRMGVLTREMLIVLVLLFLFFFLGDEILGGLGLSGGSLNLTGGIMLFLIAVGMVFPSVASHDPQAHNPSEEPFIVPVAMPLIVGPAAISLVMMQAAMAATEDKVAEGITAMLLAWLAAALLLFSSGKILGYLGEKGTVALTRLMGTILVMIAVQMILNGITAYLQDLNVIVK